MSEEKNEYTVELSTKVIQVFENYKRKYDYTIESGGILAGRIVDHKIIIEELTEPYESDKRKRFSFKRESFGHQAYMDEIWAKSDNALTYLGEWHSHDQKEISPSIIDYSNWKRIMRRTHNSEVLVFLILGRVDVAVWIGKGGELIRIDDVKYNEDNKKDS